MPATVQVFTSAGPNYLADWLINYDEWQVELAPPTTPTPTPTEWVRVRAVSWASATVYDYDGNIVAQLDGVVDGEVRVHYQLPNSPDQVFVALSDPSGAFGGSRVNLSLVLRDRGWGYTSAVWASGSDGLPYYGWDQWYGGVGEPVSHGFDAFGFGTPAALNGTYIEGPGGYDFGPVAGRFDLDWGAVDPDAATQTLPLTKLYVEARSRTWDFHQFWLGDVTDAVATFAHGVLTEVRAVTNPKGGLPALNVVWQVPAEGGPLTGGGAVQVAPAAAPNNPLVNAPAPVKGGGTTIDFDTFPKYGNYTLDVALWVEYADGSVGQVNALGGKRFASTGPGGNVPVDMEDVREAVQDAITNAGFVAVDKSPTTLKVTAGGGRAVVTRIEMTIAGTNVNGQPLVIFGPNAAPGFLPRAKGYLPVYLNGVKLE